MERAGRRRCVAVAIAASLLPAPLASAPRGVTARNARLRLLDHFTAEGGPIAPGPAPRGLADLTPDGCATCHAEIAAEWQRSGHARAFVDEIFLAEYQRGKERFCQRCHAPLVTDPSASDAPALFTRGVDCAVCHVRDGHVLGPSGRGDDDHASRRDARLATSAFCGSCHQFDFPQAEPGQTPRYHPGEPLQNTLVEWKRSRYAETSCQRCHMPRVASLDADARPHASHDFSVLRDPARLARAVKVAARARRHAERVTVTVTLTLDRIGHDFPTGDMFRQAHLEVRLGAERRRAVLQRVFAQTMTADARGHRLGQVDDTRVRAGAAPWRQTFTFDRPAAEISTATWELTLYRLDPATAAERKLAPAAITIPIARGTVDLPR